MKNTSSLRRAIGLAAMTIVIGLAATACNQPTGTHQQQPEPQPDPNAAKVVIALPSAPQGRSLGLDTVIEYTNYFQVFFRRTDVTPYTFHSASATIEQGVIEITVPAGTHDILLFAGHRRTAGSNPLLLASSYMLDRQLVVGIVNEVEMQLATFDVSITAPDNVDSAENFPVTVDVYTANPLITELPASGAGIPLSLFSQSGTVTLPFAGTGHNLWTYAGTVTAPASNVSSIMWLDGLSLTPLGHDPLGSWYWTVPTAWGDAFDALLIGRPIIIGTPDVNIIITWPDGSNVWQPITITVQGIPSDYHGSWAGLNLIIPETRNTVAWEWQQLGSSATFQMWVEDERFYEAGYYEVRFRICCCDGGYVYSAGVRFIPAGTSTIEWDYFDLVPPVNITVTGIPADYHGDDARMVLFAPGTFNSVGEAWTGIQGPNETFTVQGAGPGIYDVALVFICDYYWETLAIYHAPAESITGDTDIPFSRFTPMPPSITLTIAGIPADYQGGYAEVELWRPGTEDGGWYSTEVTGSSADFRFWFIEPGDLYFYMWIEGTAGWAELIAEGVTIGATATIQWADLTRIGGGEPIGEPIYVTVTGIPDQYHGDWGDLYFLQPGTDIDVSWHAVSDVTASTTFRMQAEPGVYDLVLWLDDYGVAYSLPNRTIAAGTNTIAFSYFSLMPLGLSARPERQGRADEPRGRRLPAPMQGGRARR